MAGPRKRIWFPKPRHINLRVGVFVALQLRASFNSLSLAGLAWRMVLFTIVRLFQNFFRPIKIDIFGDRTPNRTNPNLIHRLTLRKWQKDSEISWRCVCSPSSEYKSPSQQWMAFLSELMTNYATAVRVLVWHDSLSAQLGVQLMETNGKIINKMSRED